MPDHHTEAPLATKAPSTGTDEPEDSDTTTDTPIKSVIYEVRRRHQGIKDTKPSNKPVAARTPPTVLIMTDRSELDTGLVDILQKRGYLTVEADRTDEAMCLLDHLDISVAIIETDFRDVRKASRNAAERFEAVPLLIKNRPSPRAPSAETIVRAVAAICPARTGPW